MVPAKGAAVAVATDGTERLSKFTAGRWDVEELIGANEHQSISSSTICWRSSSAAVVGRLRASFQPICSARAIASAMNHLKTWRPWLCSKYFANKTILSVASGLCIAGYVIAKPAFQEERSIDRMSTLLSFVRRLSKIEWSVALFSSAWGRSRAAMS